MHSPRRARASHNASLAAANVAARNVSKVKRCVDEMLMLSDMLR